MMAETTTVALPDLDTAPPSLALHADTALAVTSDALLRVSELNALTVADIDMTEQTITV